MGEGICGDDEEIFANKTSHSRRRYRIGGGEMAKQKLEEIPDLRFKVRLGVSYGLVVSLLFGKQQCLLVFLLFFLCESGVVDAYMKGDCELQWRKEFQVHAFFVLPTCNPIRPVSTRRDLGQCVWLMAM